MYTGLVHRVVYPFNSQLLPVLINQPQRDGTLSWHWTYSYTNFYLTRSLPGQLFPECHPQLGFSFAKVPAGYLLWCRCTAELHVLNDEYTRPWHLTMHIN